MTIRPPGKLRIAAPLIIPLIIPLAGALGATAARRVPLAGAALVVLGALWLAMIGALALRVRHEARRPGARGVDERSAWDHADVLTETGRAMLWTGGAALVAAAATGWASLSVIGSLGLGTVYLTAAWTLGVAGGRAPWHGARIARAILPELAVEGDPLREELRITGVRIPAGMRMFAVGRTTRHGAISRYAVDASASRGELRLASELGPAVRGEHRAPPLALWLGDVLGLTRSPAIRAGAASFAVLPRPAVIRGVAAVTGTGDDDARAQPIERQPTEGTFRIRDYLPGDDTRRIHWVRSLQTDQLVVRLPDELPQAEAEIRLILDNELADVGQLSCPAPQELLDALVRVWLGVARALAAHGHRVTLVAAVDHAGAIAAVERTMAARAPAPALRLGGRVAWQAALPLAALVARQPVRQVIVSSRPRELSAAAETSWLLVPEIAWTSAEPVPAVPGLARLPFPSGSDENRRDHRRRARSRLEARLRDRALFSQVKGWMSLRAWSGHVVARPAQGGVLLQVIP